jgi:hypothetical protein
MAEERAGGGERSVDFDGAKDKDFCGRDLRRACGGASASRVVHTLEEGVLI